MFKKILDAINIFKPIEGVVINTVVGKGIRAIIQFLAGYYIAHPIIKDIGITIDFTKLESWALPAAIGLAASLWNWVKTRYKKS